MATKIYELADLKIHDGSDESPNGSFEGYGSIYGNYDRVDEAVEAGAFKNIDDFVKNGFIASGHAWDNLPIATITEAVSDSIGLKIKAEYHSTQAAQDARKVMSERLARGKFVGLSIGYSVLDSEATDKGRVLKALELFEISFVTVPANPLAGVTSAKSAPLAGSSLDDHTELVLAEAKGLTTRLQALQELRAKDNRNISAARRADLAELKGLVDELFALTAPKVDPIQARAIAARILAAR